MSSPVMRIFAVLLCFVSVSAQTVPAPAIDVRTIEELRRIQAASLADDYAYERTRYMTNNIGPRLSGSPQAARAVEYVADEMKKLGLEVTLQEVKVPHWERGRET